MSSTDLQGLADPCSTSVTGTTNSDLSSRYTYDKAGNLVTAIDAAADTQAYAFDRLGRMTSRNDGVGATEQWQYDQRGNRTALVSRTSTPSTSVTWAYDKADRNTTRTADSATTTYTYDADGDMLTAASATGTITATYYRSNRVNTVTPDDGSTATDYGYGLDDATRVDISGSYSFDLDKWGRQTSMDPPYSAALTQTWRADGMPLRDVDTDGNTTDRSYDTAGRLTGISSSGTGCAGVGNSNCAVYTYTVNRAGLWRTEASTIDGDPANGTASFAYDSVGRLTGYDSPLGSTSDKDYAWAKVLDRTAVTTNPSGTPATVTTSFNAADRPTSDSSGGAYTHDANGRMTARPGQKLEWDSLGRLTTVRDGTTNAVISSYTYDALDRLREIASGGTTTRMRYVGLTTAIASSYNVTTSSLIRYYATNWDGSAVGIFTGSANSQYAYGANGHGDMTWLADYTGAVTRTYRYDPWGTTIGSSGSGTTTFLRWQGSWRDTATDLVWAVTRWYAPTQGRFVSEDTILGAPTNPDSRHLYAYANGEPVGRWDPDGRQTWGFGEADVKFSSELYLFSQCHHQPDRPQGAPLDMTAQGVAGSWAKCTVMIRSKGKVLTHSHQPGSLRLTVRGDFTWSFEGSGIGAPPTLPISAATFWAVVTTRIWDTTTKSVIQKFTYGTANLYCEAHDSDGYTCLGDQRSASMPASRTFSVSALHANRKYKVDFFLEVGVAVGGLASAGTKMTAEHLSASLGFSK